MEIREDILNLPYPFPKPYNGEIHLWRVSLESELAFTRLHDFYDVLSTAEHERASRYYFAQDMHGFIVRRGLLRRLIAHYLEIEPGEVLFQIEKFGKPHVQTSKSAPLQFSASHSGNAILLGFTVGQRIGVDIEYMQDNSNIDLILHSRFSPGEKALILNSENAKHTELFYKYWTLKEALVKATGRGLHAFDKIDLSSGQCLESDSVLQVPAEGTCGTYNQWSLKALNSAGGYSAAVAVDGNIGRIRSWALGECTPIDV